MWYDVLEQYITSISMVYIGLYIMRSNAAPYCSHSAYYLYMMIHTNLATNPPFCLASAVWMYPLIVVTQLSVFYRAMHFSAKRGIAIACRLSVCPSVCPSVCDAGGYIQRHHTGMRGAGVAPVGCQPQGPACRQPTANTAPVVHLSQPKLVPTLLLGGQGYMCVNNLPKVVTRYASVGDQTRDLPIASRER